MPSTSTNLVISRFFQEMGRFSPFESQPEVVVATSGGPDSLALCLLLNKWIATNQGKLISLTVDHLLRKESTNEAIKVNQWLTNRGIEHHILSWEGNKPTTDIQNKARAARYQLLEQWCKQHHILHLFLAHHADDQEETILQRLLHGSGPLGLQGMKECTYHPFGRILRPLLSFSKQELIDYLDQEKQDYFLDPSNKNAQFGRVKARTILPQLHKITTTPRPFIQTAQKCGDFVEIAFSAMTEFFLNAASLSQFGFLEIAKKPFFELALPLQALVLSQGVQAIGGNPYPFSFKQLNIVFQKIYNNQNTTIGGCLIILKSNHILIVREARALAGSVIIQGNQTLWDNRFLLSVPNHFIGSHIIPQAFIAKKHRMFLPELPEYIQKTLPLLQQQDGTIFPIPTPEQGITWQLSFKNKLLPPINIVPCSLNMLGLL